ncbi:MAG: hypothetical protein V4487_07030 [Chlamydiota bacterium]
MFHVTQVNAAGCCSNLYKATADSANWLGRNVKSAGVSVWDSVKKAAAYVGAFFAKIGQYAQQGYQAVKGMAVEGFASAKAFVATHPKEFKIAAITTAMGIVIAAILCRSCKKAEAPAATPNAAPANVPAGGNTPAGNAPANVPATGNAPAGNAPANVPAAGNAPANVPPANVPADGNAPANAPGAPEAPVNGVGVLPPALNVAPPQAQAPAVAPQAPAVHAA